MPETKEVSLDLRKRFVDTNKAEDGHTKLSQIFQVSRTGGKSNQEIQREAHSKEQASEK